MPEVDSALIADLLADGLQQGKTPRLTLTSNSMAPLLLKGDQIGLEAAPPDGLRPGDIVVVSAANVLVTHRFWGRRGRELVTKGDRSLSFDPLWAPEQLVGRVISRRRAGREFDLQSGTGQWLNRRLFAHAQAESRLFAGFAPSPLATAEENSRYLGRLMRRRRDHLLPRGVRRMIRAMNGALCHIAGWQDQLARRGKMRFLRITLAFTIIVFLLGVLLVPGRQARANVTLARFYATSGAAEIVLHWETVSETETLGFHVWRGTDCDPGNSIRVNNSLIPAEGDVATGASYSLADTNVEPGILYNYRLEDVELNGTSTCHQEPEFQVQALIDTGGNLVTATPGGNFDPGATSTSAPANTPAPSNTPLPTNTPQPQGTALSPTATQAALSSPTVSSQTGNDPPPTATTPATVASETSGQIEATVTPPAGGNDGDTEGATDQVNVGETVGDPAGRTTSTPVAVADAGTGSAESQAEDSETQLNLNQVIGENSDFTNERSASAGNQSTDGNPRTIVAFTGLIGGLIVLLGGAVAVWLLVLNRKS